jgi:hypothetical protein
MSSIEERIQNRVKELLQKEQEDYIEREAQRRFLLQKKQIYQTFCTKPIFEEEDNPINYEEEDNPINYH